MQTRRLRLGDVVDDYCPRERRLSNHVIVAIVDDTIKQTRCSTCDFEHPYKEAKVPPRRKKKDAPSALFQQVLENVTTERVVPQPSAEIAVAPPEPEPVSAPAVAPPAAAPPPAAVAASAAAGASAGAPPPAPRPTPRPRAVKPAGRVAPPAVGAAPILVTPVVVAPPAAAANATASPEPNAAPTAHANANANANTTANGDANPQPDAHEEDAPLHRRSLIRATLPRPVGEVPVRQPPSFTIREAAAARPNKFRYKARPPGAGGRQGRPQGVGVSSGNQARPGGARGPQGRGAGKKSGAQPHQHRAGGHQSARGPKGPHGNKRFK